MDVDETLRRAAQQLSASLAEEPIPNAPRPTRRSWVVAVVGALVTLTTVGGIAVLMRGDSSPQGGIDSVSSTTVSSSTTTTLPTTAGDIQFVSDEHGFEITYPADWYRSDEILAPALTSPPQGIEEVLSLGTYPLRPGGAKCPHVPLNALLDLGSDDVLISIILGNQGTGDPWPAAFGTSSFLPAPDAGDAPIDARTCSGRSDLGYHFGVFTLDGRQVQIFVALGDGVDDATRTQTWGILDSFTWAHPSGDLPQPIVTPFATEQPVPLRVLAVRPNSPSLVVLDFSAGTTTRYPPSVHALPLDATDGAVMTPNREMIIWTNGVAHLFTDSLGVADADLGPNPPRSISGIAPSLRVVPSPDGRRAWLVQPGIGYGTDHYPTLAELIELPDGRRLQSYEADTNAFPVAATSTGLVLNTHVWFDTGDGFTIQPGSERVIHLGEDGNVAEVGSGWAIAASDSIVIRLAHQSDQPDGDLHRSNILILSDADGANEFVIAKPFDGAWFDLGGPSIPSDAMPLRTTSPDGSTVLVGLGEGLDVNGSPTRSVLVAIDIDDGTSRIIAEFNGAPPPTTWSADGQWIALLDSDDIQLINAANPDIVTTFTNVIPPDHFVFAAG